MIRKIQNQLILFACLPVVLLGSVLGYYFINSRIQGIEANLVNRGQTIARQSASALEYSVLIENYSIMREISDSIFDEPDVTAVLVKNKFSHILYSRSLVPTVQVHEDNSISDHSLVFTAPIVQKAVEVEDFSDSQNRTSTSYEDEIGTIEIYLDKTLLIDQQYEVIKNGILITLACLLGMIALAIYLGRKIGLPIVRLTDSVNKIAKGDLSERVSEESTSEIGQLEKGVNNMAEAIEEGRHQLQRKIDQVTENFNAATQALKDSESKYRDLFENASDVVVTFNTNGELISTNNAFSEEIYDTKEDNLMPHWSEVVAPQSRPRALRINKKHMTSDERLTYELDIITKNNVVKTFEISSRSITKDKNIIGIHAIARDITKRIEFQQALVEARKAAEMASKAKSGFLANMSHEIRTPISGIIGFLDLLSESGLTNEQKRLVDPVVQSSNQLVAIVNDILDFAKIEAQQIDLQNKPFELYEVVSQSMDMLMPMASRKKIDLKFDKQEDDSCYLIGDAVRVSQIITNLVSNAIKFTDQGYVSVSVKHQSVSADNKKIVIIVEDTGIGISDEDKDHLFDPFWQADSSLNRKFEGSGLGLAIAYHFIELMGGNINIEDNNQRGTRFIVSLTLPKHDESLGKFKAREQRLDYEFLSSLKVLVIDDNSIVREYFKTMLTGMQLSHQQVSNRDQALDACKNDRFDLVFLDLHMPEVDGIQTFSDIRNNTEIYQPKIIISLTADAIVGNREKVLEHGFDDFVAKPMTKLDFIRLVQKWFPDKISVNQISRSDKPVLDHDILNSKLGIELANNNEELWKQSVRELLKDIPHYINVLDSSYSPGSAEMLYNEVHKLAGTCSYIGANDLQNCARQLMNLLQSEHKNIEKAIEINALRQSLHKFVEVAKKL